MSVMDILSNISSSDTTMEYHESDYKQRVINKGLSYFIDSILYVNEVNQRHYLTNKQHYDYLFNSLRKKKRFSKWHKKTPIDNVDLVMQSYKYNQTKAEEAIKLLSDEQIDKLRERLEQGGRV
jgi:hypothetical protein